ncbi:endoplasmic reticulum resident protein 29 [Achroia grisella]|uniref:endoplasmic reticulum resident protein 29 n=1 Tax=Achroia grisella TaxID=688607 RepID=UPI0027D2C1D6|nr:endoplasmic reticulum resident protein 29 [Achroia grisella]XP_059052133.1 endoplasmic reticulum resident protein 29 [Achroia grisella]
MLTMQRLLFICIVLIAPAIYEASNAAIGSVGLDEISFDKVIKKFEATLVKFDVAFPYGDKHDAFVALAKDAKELDDLLIAEVGVKDYGEKDNEQLANKYGATKDNFPVVKLFIKGKDEPIPFDESRGFTSDELRRFIREKTGMYLSLPGCVKELDKLAQKFMKASIENRKKVLKETEDIQKKLSSKDATSGKIYKTIMEKILEKGNDFINTESERVKKILNSKVSEEKKKELGIRTNVLQSFQLLSSKHGNVIGGNDEL